ncbi:MAG: Calx-beta domain-containing protein, partial [Pirellulales bacterium]
GSNTLKNLGSFIDNGSGGLSRARSSIIGPDGNIYVVSADTNSILRYDPTGEYINAFVQSGSGGLSSPGYLVFGPDSDLYVTSSGNGEVLRYDGTSGAFLNVVASGLSPGGLTFGSDGNLYVANQNTNEVLQYNMSTATLSSFVTAGSGGLSWPRRAVFGPDGNLYVASNGTSQVLEYNGQTGAFMGVFATNSASTGALWMQFGNDGRLYVATNSTSSANTTILRFNATTGAFVDSFVPARASWSFNIGPNNVIYDSSAQNNNSGGFVDLIGPSSVAAFTVSLAGPVPGTTTVNYSTADGTARAGRDYVAASGTLTFAPGETAKTILVSTIDDGVAGPTKAFSINLSNPTGGVITTGQGIGTILDDTKFYVVDGGASHSTYQY